MDPDQTDIIAANEKLTTDLAAAQADLAAGQVLLTTAQADITAGTVSLAVAQARIAALEAQATESATQTAALTAQVATLTTENAAMKLEVADFNKRLAAELSKHGIRKAALSVAGDTVQDSAKAGEDILRAVMQERVAKGMPVAEQYKHLLQ